MTNSRIIKVIGIGMLLVVLGTGVFGQEDTKNNKDKTSRSNATVNPTSLGLELSIPLGNAPGRAGNSLPITFNYSSKVWRMEPIYVTNPANGGFPATTDIHNFPMYGEDSDAGWTTSLQAPYLEETSLEKIVNREHIGGINVAPGTWGCILANDFCSCVTDASGASSICPILPNSNITNTNTHPAFYKIFKYTLHLSDGSTHELVNNLSPIFVDENQPVPPTPTTYFSVDGSNLRLEGGIL